MAYRGSFYDDDERETTTISISKINAEIFTIYKSRKKLPTMDSIIHYLYANLSESAKAELKVICDFLEIPPPLKNTREVQLQHNFRAFELSDDEIRKYANDVFNAFVKEKGIDSAKTADDADIYHYIDMVRKLAEKDGVSTIAIYKDEDIIISKFRERAKSIT